MAITTPLEGSGAPGTASTTSEEREAPRGSRLPARRTLVIVLAVLVIVSASLAAILVVYEGPSPPTEVTVTSSSVSVSYTNLPSGQRSPDAALEVNWAWSNATAEQPQSFGAAPGSTMFLDVVIQFEPDQGADNCSVTGLTVGSPFSIASIEGTFGGPAGLRSDPFPLNFSGQTMLNNTPAELAVNVTLPDEAGSYAPSFVLSSSCESYSPE